MKCLKCNNTNLSMLVRMTVIFPVDSNGDIYINDYEGYDDLLEETINDLGKEDQSGEQMKRMIRMINKEWMSKYYIKIGDKEYDN